MVRIRRAAGLAIVVLGFVSGAAAAAEAILDIIPAGGTPSIKSAILTLDGTPAVVEALGEPTPPTAVAVVVGSSGLAPGARRDLLAAAARLNAAEGGPLVLAAVVDDGLTVPLRTTPPGEEAAAALARLEAGPSVGPRDDTRAGLVESIAELAAAGGTATSMVDVQALLRRVESHISRRRIATLRRIAAIDELVRCLAAIPGRKALLLISGELPSRPGEELARAWNGAFPDAGSRTLAALAGAGGDVTSFLDALAADAAARRVALYPTRSLGDAAARLAIATGGRVVDLGSLGDVMERACELRFVPPDGAAAGAGRVAVRMGGHEARTPARWVAADAAAVAADRTLGAVRLGAADNPLELTVSIRPTHVRDDGTRVVPLMVSVPIARLVLADVDGGREGRVAVFTAASGRREVDRQDFPISLPESSFEKAMTSRAGFVVGVELAPGNHLVAVGLLDVIAGASSAMLIRLTVD
jgi:hypothetical protein